MLTITLGTPQFCPLQGAVYFYLFELEASHTATNVDEYRSGKGRAWRNHNLFYVKVNYLKEFMNTVEKQQKSKESNYAVHGFFVR